MTERVSPRRYAVEFRSVRQTGGMWEVEGTYRLPADANPRKFLVRLSLQGTVRLKEIEPP